jgi:hypothetical protein
MIDFNQIDPTLAFEIGELEKQARKETVERIQKLIASAIDNPDTRQVSSTVALHLLRVVLPTILEEEEPDGEAQV